MSESTDGAGSAGAELREILTRLVAGVRQDVEALPDRQDERVHDIRVGMKKFRAVIRMARGVLSKKSLVRADKLARNLKEHFATARDLDVLNALLADLPGGDHAATVLGIAPDVRAAGAQADPAATELCEALAAFAGGLDLDELSPADLRGVWVDTYRTARRVMKDCSRNTNNDLLFHKWRKRVKELLYQTSVVATLDADGNIARKADELSSILGHHHDLALLCARLDHDLRGSETGHAAREKKAELARRALEAGGLLFSKKPSRLLSEP